MLQCPLVLGSNVALVALQELRDEYLTALAEHPGKTLRLRLFVEDAEAEDWTAENCERWRR
jgi:hypothetical protein